jgi:hypothetical protein
MTAISPGLRLPENHRSEHGPPVVNPDGLGLEGAEDSGWPKEFADETGEATEEPSGADD